MSRYSLTDRKSVQLIYSRLHVTGIARSVAVINKIQYAATNFVQFPSTTRYHREKIAAKNHRKF